MSYALHDHLSAGSGCSPALIDGGAVRRFALVDAGQLPRKAALAVQACMGPKRLALFEGTFAEAALPLSPWLAELSAERDQFAERVRQIDAHCASLPVFSLLASVQSLDSLAAHLREHLRVEADGTEYLLRLADTQMLHAFAQALMPGQLAGLLAGIETWCFVDHAGLLVDLAAPRTPDSRCEPATRISAAQTDALLQAAALPIAAAQLRAYDPSFALLGHREQMQFLDQCRSSMLEPDSQGDLLAQAVNCWQARSGERDEIRA